MVEFEKGILKTNNTKKAEEKLEAFIDKRGKKIQEEIENNYDFLSVEEEKQFFAVLESVKKFLDNLSVKLKIDLDNIVCLTTDSEPYPNYDITKNTIIIPEYIFDEEEEVFNFVLSHEIFHSLSSLKTQILLDDLDEEDVYFIKNKIGFSSAYHKYIDKKGEQSYQIFNAFNEGVTDLLAYNLTGNSNLISYVKESEVVDIFLKNIFNSQEKEKHFLNGYFNGDKMFLREIEKFYGPGSLRLLAF